MPTFIAAIAGAFLRITASFVGRVLLNLGIAVVTFKGMDTSFQILKSQALSSFMGLPAQIISLLSYMRVGEAFSIIMSAIVARMALDAVNGTVKRFVKK